MLCLLRSWAWLSSKNWAGAGELYELLLFVGTLLTHRFIDVDNTAFLGITPTFPVFAVYFLDW